MQINLFQEFVSIFTQSWPRIWEHISSNAALRNLLFSSRLITPPFIISMRREEYTDATKCDLTRTTLLGSQKRGDENQDLNPNQEEIYFPRKMSNFGKIMQYFIPLFIDCNGGLQVKKTVTTHTKNLYSTIYFIHKEKWNFYVINSHFLNLTHNPLNFPLILPLVWIWWWPKSVPTLLTWIVTCVRALGFDLNHC